MMKARQFIFRFFFFFFYILSVKKTTSINCDVFLVCSLPADEMCWKAGQCLSLIANLATGFWFLFTECKIYALLHLIHLPFDPDFWKKSTNQCKIDILCPLCLFCELNF